MSGSGIARISAALRTCHGVKAVKSEESCDSIMSRRRLRTIEADTFLMRDLKLFKAGSPYEERLRRLNCKLGSCENAIRAIFTLFKSSCVTVSYGDLLALFFSCSLNLRM